MTTSFAALGGFAVATSACVPSSTASAGQEESGTSTPWWINVKDFGATGLGSPNNDDTDAINRAIAALAVPGAPAWLFFPAGNYYISSTLSIPASTINAKNGNRGFTLSGEGAGSCIVTDQQITMLSLGTLSDGTGGVRVSDLQIISTAPTPSAPAPGSSTAALPTGLQMNNIGHFWLERLLVNGSALAVSVLGAGFGAANMLGCDLAGSLVGLYIQDGIVVTNCVIKGATYGIIFDSCGGGTHLNRVGLYGLVCLSTWGSTSNALYARNVEANFNGHDKGLDGRVLPWGPELGKVGNAYLANINADCHLSECWLPGGTLFGTPSHVLVTQCELGAYQHSKDGFTLHALEIAAGDNLIIQGNNVGGQATGYGIQIGTNASSAMISGNSFYTHPLAYVNILAPSTFSVCGNIFQGSSTPVLFSPATNYIIANNLPPTSDGKG